MSFKADLHCHSTYSDGTLTPKELVELAEEKNIQALSITDHDGISAYPEVFALAKPSGLLILPGVEFSTVFEEQSIHILAYSFDFTNKALKALCDAHVERRRKRNEEIIGKLQKKGFAISLEELYTSPTHMVGRPHIAELLVKKGFLKDSLTAFHYFLGEGKSCFALGQSVSVEETLATIHEAKGLAVIAHPHLIRNRKKVLKLLQLPFDGLECEYALMGPLKNQRWYDLAEQKGLLITGGSDFHGPVKHHVPLGAATLSQKHFEPLFSHFKTYHGHLLASS